jgi:hypothetical protein
MAREEILRYWHVALYMILRGAYYEGNERDERWCRRMVYFASDSIGALGVSIDKRLCIMCL